MPRRFKSPWGDKRPPKTHGSPAASAEADCESGNEGVGSGDKDLYALEVMRKRGLISEEEYLRRKATIKAAGA